MSADHAFGAASMFPVLFSIRGPIITSIVPRYGPYFDDSTQRNYTGQKYIVEMDVETQRMTKELSSAKFVDL